MQNPAFKYASTTDQSSDLLGVRCVKLEDKLPGSSWTDFAHWYKIAQLIESLGL